MLLLIIIIVLLLGFLLGGACCNGSSYRPYGLGICGILLLALLVPLFTGGLGGLHI